MPDLNAHPPDDKQGGRNLAGTPARAVDTTEEGADDMTPGSTDGAASGEPEDDDLL